MLLFGIRITELPERLGQKKHKTEDITHKIMNEKGRKNEKGERRNASPPTRDKENNMRAGIYIYILNMLTKNT